MKSKKLNNILIFFISTILWVSGCNSGPKIIESVPVSNSAEPADISLSLGTNSEKEHMVVVMEVLNTEKYTYLNVDEEGTNFWIAIPKKEVQIGATYYYKGGLLKKNFESKEYNRVFETLYLVSDVIPHPIDGSEFAAGQVPSQQSSDSQAPISVNSVEGSIKLSELFLNPDKYEGQIVQVSGKCVKVNPMIMGRNWVHIQDGSGDNLDLTVTTAVNIPVDAIVTLTGIISLNKDFGAGYRYDVIMENATLK